MGFVCDQSVQGDLGKRMYCTRGRCPQHFTVSVLTCIVVGLRGQPHMLAVLGKWDRGRGISKFENKVHCHCH